MARNETIYGEGILADELGRLGDCVVVTDKVPWRLYNYFFDRTPVKVVMPGSLEQSVLDDVARSLPDGPQVVALGGGSVIDAAKYFAYLRGQTPVLIPTITSSNAPFSESIAVRRHGRPFGFKKQGWPRRIIVDYDLIRTADDRLNRAGYGDLLSMQTALNDWRIASRGGKNVPIDPALEEALSRMMQEALQCAPEIGHVSQQGIETLMRLFQQTTELTIDNPSAPIAAGSEHLFAWNLESVTGKHFIHGEVVSLGIVICSYLQGSDHNELVDALKVARVVHTPFQIGVLWEEIEESLQTIQEYNYKVRRFNTVFDEVIWTPELLAEIRQLLLSLEEES